MPTFSSNRLLWWLVAIAVFAFAVRLAYQSGVVSVRDSSGDISLALNSGRTSLYFYFQDAILRLFNTENLRVVITAQALVDSFTVVAIALAAMAFSRDLVIPAALTAAVIPNFLVHSSSILPETLFVAFFAWGLCFLLWAIRDQIVVSRIWISGLLFGLALLCRPVLIFFPILLLPVLAYVLHTKHQSWLRSFALAFIPALVMAAVVSPLLLYNFLNFGYLQLSSQPGPHLLFWVYGCLATSWPCAERARIVAELMPIVTERIQTLGVDRANEFTVSAIERDLAIKLLIDLPCWQIAWGMTWGAFKNLMQTGFYQVFTQYDQPATFFSAIHGGNFAERFRNFVLVNWGNYYMMMWVLSQLCLGASRCVQLYGIFRGVHDRNYRALSIVLLFTISYFLLINGPVADPKYRMPLEPCLIIFFALGITPVINWISVRLIHPKSASA
jgi:4-amino-4-deoxy-L-arabinose transferase-like glycosyltransferase